MKKTHFYSPLALAVATVLSVPAFADDTKEEQAIPTVHLGTLKVTTDRQGAKIKTNVVTTAIKDETTDNDLRELLKDEPAIEFGGGNGMSSFWSIRGMGQNSIDVKVDNAYNDSSILYHQGRHMLDPSLVKIVSVQKGAGSASAGIGQTNGAIIAKTVDAQDLLKNSTNPNYGFKLNGGYNSNEGHQYGASVFGKAGNFDALVAYNAVIEKDYKPGKGFEVDGKDTYPYSALDKIAYLAKAGVNLGNHRLVASHQFETHNGVRLVREEFFASATAAGGRLTEQRQSPAYRETSKTNTNLEWTAKNLGFISALNANAYKLEQKRYSADDSGCGYCGSIKGETNTIIDTKGANLNLDSDIGENTTIKYGVNYRHQEIKPHAFLHKTVQLVNPEKTDTGVYAEAVHNIGAFTLTGGVRYDNFKYQTHDGKSVSGSQANPSLSVIFSPTEYLSLNASHNYATRSPRLYDALMTHGARGIVSVADDVKAERATNTEVGFNYKRPLTNGGTFTLDGSYFNQKIDDALANPQNRHDVDGVREVVNAGYIKNKGYEFGVGYKDKNITTKFGVAHSEPRIYDTHKDNLLSDNPEFAVQTGRTWTGSLGYRFDNPNLEIGVKHRVVESAYNSVLVRNASPANRESYNVSDIYANWKPFNNDKLNINFGVNNVFDEFYQPHSQRSAITTPYAIGRDFRVGFNYTY